MTTQPASDARPGTPLLAVEDLRVSFRTREGTVPVLNGVSFEIERGEVVALLGESGSGKSVTAQAIMGILPRATGRVDAGVVRLDGTDVLTLPEQQRVQIRGERVAMVFQDALSALNPVYRVGDQITEVYRRRHRVSRKQARAKALELMDLVRIPDAARRVNDFPHQFSGGMRQRIMIATALVLEPEVLIADEPTTALDVTVQAEIMELLDEIRRERNMSVLLITHDMGVVANTADRVCVMYAGSVVEHGPAKDVFSRPAHPYTEGMLRSIPKMARPTGLQFSIPGAPPRPGLAPSGCPFRDRCPAAVGECAEEQPRLVTVGEGHQAACIFAGQLTNSWEDR